MKLQMKEWKVVRFSFNVKEKEKISKENCEFSFGSAFPDSTPKEFVIGFLLKIIEESYDIDMEMQFIFKSNEEIDEEFKKSDFVNISAPAIAFPYLRSFLTNFTLQSGFKPLILPSVNFIERSKIKKE